MTIREKIYQHERESLSKYAMLSENTIGREYPIEESDIRTEFMRDRDRITHSKAFRRLKDKTQVFINPEGSHYRTRLTHTPEVTQLAKTISRCLALNEDLTEAIGLGHDLGHTPFGHAGEFAINDYYRDHGMDLSFAHNLQSVRIVEKLENGTGLNLTYEVRDGIRNHKKGMKPMTLEGMAVNYSDRIAYLNHDIDDSLRAGIITEADLPREAIQVLGDSYSVRINTMITDIVNNSVGKDRLIMSPEIERATDILREFMFEEVYRDSPAKIEEKKVRNIIYLLMDYYLAHPDKLPEDDRGNIETDGLAVCVTDYIAGMTDKYAVQVFDDLYVPHAWQLL
ncbi:MAG: deoxyguanosinetriphosphate triphosphohydrolase [Clostridia bacterium]|nr:deoxyguanosinetriphosphate triphosphohydrolase [Clostridia bacterium]